MDMIPEVTEHAIELPEEEPFIGYNCQSDLNELNKRVKRIEFLVYVAIVLALAAVIILLINRPAANQSSQKVLPNDVNTEQIVNSLKDAYNENDNHKLYDLMGDYAKTSVSFEQTQKTMDAIRPGFGKLNSVKYKGYTYQGSDNTGEYFLVQYLGEYDAGPGSLTLTIRVAGDQWELVGFNFNMNS